MPVVYSISHFYATSREHDKTAPKGGYFKMNLANANSHYRIFYYFFVNQATLQPSPLKFE
jgi:hypothetical protein